MLWPPPLCIGLTCCSPSTSAGRWLLQSHLQGLHSLALNPFGLCSLHRPTLTPHLSVLYMLCVMPQLLPSLQPSCLSCISRLFCEHNQHPAPLSSFFQSFLALRSAQRGCNTARGTARSSVCQIWLRATTTWEILRKGTSPTAPPQQQGLLPAPAACWRCSSCLQHGAPHAALPLLPAELRSSQPQQGRPFLSGGDPRMLQLPSAIPRFLTLLEVSPAAGSASADGSKTQRWERRTWAT